MTKMCSFTKRLLVGVVVTLACGYTLSAVGEWTYDAEHNTVTVGDWVFNSAVEEGGIALMSLKTAGVATSLDFSTCATAGAPKIVRAADSLLCDEKYVSKMPNVTDLVLPDDMVEIGMHAFRAAPKLQRVHLPTDLQTLKAGAFARCPALVSVQPFLPASLTFLGASAFGTAQQNSGGDTKLRGDLILSNPSLELATYARWEDAVFYLSGIDSVDFTGSQLTTLPTQMFRECPNMTKVVLPETFEHFPVAAFYKNSKLKEVWFKSFADPVGDPTAFYQSGANYTTRFCYPATDKAWDDYIKNQASFVRWEDAGSVTNTYLAIFNDGLIPIGYAVFKDKDRTESPCARWLVPYTVSSWNVTATDYIGLEDDNYHGITVTINGLDGVEYVQEWSEDGMTFGPTEPKYQAAGEHQVWCRVSAEGCDPVTVSGKVIITLRTIMASMDAEKIVTADGQSHELPAYTVSVPVEGYSLDWSVNGVSYGSVAPSFADIGVYVATCTITAPHYATKTISGTLCLRTSGDVYVDAASTGGVSPYDAPEKAIGDLETAVKIVCDGGTVHLASGTYGLGSAQTVNRHVTVEGPADRSAIVTRNGFDVSAGSRLSGVTFDALASRALTLRQSSMASNVCVRGCTNPVYSDGGTLTDSVISKFTGHFAFKAATSVSYLTRVRIESGWLDEVNACTAPVLVGASAGTRETATLSMADCEVIGNTNRVGSSSAGFLACGGDSKMYVSMLRCRILHNSGRSAMFRGGDGGAAGNYIAVTNCLFVDNSSRNAAVGSLTLATQAVWMRGEFVNCTFTRNLSLVGDPQLGLFVCPTGASIALKNCIMSDNDLVTYYNGYDSDVPLQITTSMYPECGEDDASGNIAGPAVFRGRGETPYALKFGSPGIGAGAILGWTKNDTDLAGRRRVQGGSVDMGCYQSGAGMMIFVQ